MHKLTYFLLFYIIFGRTTLWLDSFTIRTPCTLRSPYHTFPKIVVFKPKNYCVCPLLPNSMLTQSSWLVLSHSSGVTIFSRRSNNNFCASLVLVAKSSTIFCTHSTHAMNTSVSVMASSIGAYSTYMCATLCSTSVETMNASSIHG